MTLKWIDLLPWHVNHKTTPGEHQAAGEAAQHHPVELALWQAVQTAVLSQPQLAPSAAVRRQIMNLTRQPQLSLWRTRWLPALSGLTLTVLALLMLWNVVRPGIGLQWSVTGELPVAFQVYRAPLGSDRFEFVREIPVQPGARTYTFIDTALWPGQAYQYRVVATSMAAAHTGSAPVGAGPTIHVSGDSASDTIAAHGAEALPTQLIIVLSSLLLGLTVTYALQQFAEPPAWKYRAV
jgi:hypothetical protein